MNTERNLTGYPSTDKPWLKYYNEEAINAQPPECTVFENIWNNNKDHLSNIALNYFDRKITYKELFDNIEKAAKAFAASGIKSGDIVTIISVTIPEVVYSFYALNRIGAVANIVDPRTNFERIEEYINTAKSPFVIVLDIAAEKIAPLKSNKNVKKIITVSAKTSMPFIAGLVYSAKTRGKAKPNDFMTWQQFISTHSAEFKDAEYKANSTAAIVYTGGTTGIPKGVELSNKTFNTIAFQCGNLSFNYARNRNFLNIMPPFIAYGIVTGLNVPLSCGLTNVIIPLFNPQKFDKLILKYKPLAVIGVPSHYETLLKSKRMEKADLSFLEFAAAGGDAMNAKTETELNTFLDKHNSKYHIANGYGMTELGSTAASGHGKVTKIGSVGVPHCKTVVSVFKPDSDEELRYNEEGEICIHTPAAMLGYYNNDKETANVLRMHSDGKIWAHTNDIGYIDEDGFIFIKGRIKRMIIRPDGHNVFPSAIEAVIVSHEYVESCAVVGIDDKTCTNGQWPYAFIVLKDEYKGKSEAIEAIKNYCSQKLPVRDTAEYFTEITEIPLTGIAKVDYRALEKMAEEKMKGN